MIADDALDLNEESLSKYDRTEMIFFKMSFAFATSHCATH